MIQAKSINGLTPTESEMLLQWLMDIVNRNHDLQCRLRWNNQNDIGMSSRTPWPRHAWKDCV